MLSQACNRRDFLKRLGFGIAAASLGGPPGSAEGRPARRPNILLIMSDDMGYSDIGCYGSEIKTPNLDRLAHNGLRYTQFYNTARCCPTRASLLTGLHPHQTGIGHMTGDRGNDAYRGDLNNHCVTIAQVLKTAGYATYMAGKWHVTKHTGPDGPKHNWPRQRGFDRFYGTITGAGSFYDPTTLTRDNTMITPLNDPEYKPERFYYTDAISDNAVRFIDEHCRRSGGKPFFMYVAYTAAHWPMHALQRDIAKYKGKYDNGYTAIRKARYERMKKLGVIEDHWDLSEQVGDWEGFAPKEWEARLMEVYAAMIDNMDQGIGRIVGRLKERGRLDNTLIFFLQDNGGCAEGMGRGDNAKWRLEGIKPMGPDELQKHIWPPMRTRDGRPLLGGPKIMAGPDGTYIGYGRNWANVSNTPFRQYKHWVHEGGISTPLIVHWPEGIKSRGKLRHQPSQLTDIMAACVDVSGATYPGRWQGYEIHPMEGVSLVPSFGNRPLEREALHWEHEGNRAIRMGKWKLVSKADRNAMRWDKIDELPLDRWELYDMQKDRSEMNNLAAERPELVKKMAGMWQAWAVRASVVPKPTPRKKRKG